MDERVYFSFSEADRETALALARRAEDPAEAALAFHVKPAPARFGMDRPAAMRQAAERALAGTSRTIVLVGMDTWRSPWVREEVMATLEAGRPACAIRLSDEAGPRPPCLGVHGIPVLPWSEETLQTLATAPLEDLGVTVTASGPPDPADVD